MNTIPPVQHQYIPSVPSPQPISQDTEADGLATPGVVPQHLYQPREKPFKQGGGHKGNKHHSNGNGYSHQSVQPRSQGNNDRHGDVYRNNMSGPDGPGKGKYNPNNIGPSHSYQPSQYSPGLQSFHSNRGKNQGYDRHGNQPSGRRGSSSGPSYASRQDDYANQSPNPNDPSAGLHTGGNRYSPVPSLSIPPNGLGSPYLTGYSVHGPPHSMQQLSSSPSVRDSPKQPYRQGAPMYNLPMTSSTSMPTFSTEMGGNPMMQHYPHPMPWNYGIPYPAMPPPLMMGSSQSMPHGIAYDAQDDVEVVLGNSDPAVDRHIAPRSAGAPASHVSEPGRDPLREQLEWYFSPRNLSVDTFLVSQMNADKYVPISVIAEFKKVKALTGNMMDIVAALKRSSVVSVDETGTLVKPIIVERPRTTLILRELPQDATAEEIAEIFQEAKCPAKKVTKEIGNTWFIEFDTAEGALAMLTYTRGRNLRGVPIAGRLKSNTVLTGGEYKTTTVSTPTTPGGWSAPGFSPNQPWSHASPDAIDSSLYHMPMPYRRFPTDNGSFTPPARWSPPVSMDYSYMERSSEGGPASMPTSISNPSFSRYMYPSQGMVPESRPFYNGQSWIQSPTGKGIKSGHNGDPLYPQHGYVQGNQPSNNKMSARRNSDSDFRPNAPRKKFEDGRKGYGGKKADGQRKFDPSGESQQERRGSGSGQQERRGSGSGQQSLRNERLNDGRMMRESSTSSSSAERKERKPSITHSQSQPTRLLDSQYLSTRHPAEEVPSRSSQQSSNRKEQDQILVQTTRQDLERAQEQLTGEIEAKSERSTARPVGKGYSSGKKNHANNTGVHSNVPANVTEGTSGKHGTKSLTNKFASLSTKPRRASVGATRAPSPQIRIDNFPPLPSNSQFIVLAPENVAIGQVNSSWYSNKNDADSVTQRRTSGPQWGKAAETKEQEGPIETKQPSPPLSPGSVRVRAAHQSLAATVNVEPNGGMVKAADDIVPSLSDTAQFPPVMKPKEKDMKEEHQRTDRKAGDKDRSDMASLSPVRSPTLSGASKTATGNSSGNGGFSYASALKHARELVPTEPDPVE